MWSVECGVSCKVGRVQWRGDRGVASPSVLSVECGV